VLSTAANAFSEVRNKIISSRNLKMLGWIMFTDIPDKSVWKPKVSSRPQFSGHYISPILLYGTTLSNAINDHLESPVG
jgi:hypothetical protein